MRFVAPLVTLGLSLFSPGGTVSAAQPRAAQEMLRQLKLAPSVLANVDVELRVPPQWLEMSLPHPYAAKILMNWLLSKEGQIAYYYASSYAPAHKDLMRREFIPFADEIMGKKTSFWYKGEGPGERELEAKLFDLWNPLWFGAAKKIR